MRHTSKEIEQAAKRFEQLADELDPETAEVYSTEDLREIATASDAVRIDEVRLREAVGVARARGKSWNQIAMALGVSRQAARQRFAHLTEASTPRIPGARALQRGRPTETAAETQRRTQEDETAGRASEPSGVGRHPV